MEIYYEGSDGTVIDFTKAPYYTPEPESLLTNSWEYNTISGANGLGRVKRFYKDTQEMQLLLSITEDGPEAFNEAMYKLHRTFDRDVRRLKPGKIWWNGFYKEAFAVIQSNEEFDDILESVEQTVTFISVYPYWVRKRTITLVPINDQASGTGLDYDDFDFEHDYGMDTAIEIINNDCIDAANFEIRFYGPCVNPAITIGSHVYEILDTISAGETATINSLTKKVMKYSSTGEETNIFHLRGRDDYVFKPIEEGRQAIGRNKSLRIDVTIFDERGEPVWI